VTTATTLAGIPVAVLTKRKEVAWLHPDRAVRPAE
jgi:hypothetical protein